MGVWRLVVKEALHRKLNFGLGLLAVMVAVASFVGAHTVLRVHDVRTGHIIAQKAAETRAEMVRLEDDYRKIMKGLGFNVLILPKDQNLSDLYAENYASAFMPEAYVDTLARSEIMTIRHLLPSLQQKVLWPERNRTVLLTGVRGEVPLAHRTPKEPILVPVPPGTAVLGYELHRSLGLSEGDHIRLMGRSFRVGTCNPERGNKDDIGMWIDLAEAQGLLNRPGQVTGILALKCHCYGERLGKIRAEIAGLLPDTQVIEFASQVIARAEARDRAADAAQFALEAEQVNRARLRAEQEAFAAVLVPLVLLASAVWIGLLFFLNVRERSVEIGILRAIGFSSGRVLFVFLSRAGLMGGIGALVGYGAGFGAGIFWSGGQDLAGLFDPGVLALVLVLSPVLSGVASWIPALLAGQQDPAAVLREA